MLCCVPCALGQTNCEAEARCKKNEASDAFHVRGHVNQNQNHKRDAKVLKTVCNKTKVSAEHLALA